MLTRHARECAAEQTGVQPHSAEALVYKRDGMERGADALRRASVVIQPFFLDNSFHGHNSYRTMTMRWRLRTPTPRLIFMKQRRHPTFDCKRTSNGRAYDQKGCSYVGNEENGCRSLGRRARRSGGSACLAATRMPGGAL